MNYLLMNWCMSKFKHKYKCKNLNDIVPEPYCRDPNTTYSNADRDEYGANDTFYLQGGQVVNLNSWPRVRASLNRYINKSGEDLEILNEQATKAIVYKVLSFKRQVEIKSVDYKKDEKINYWCLIEMVDENE